MPFLVQHKYLDLCHSQTEWSGHQLFRDNRSTKPSYKSITYTHEFRVSKEIFTQSCSQCAPKSCG